MSLYVEFDHEMRYLKGGFFPLQNCGLCVVYFIHSTYHTSRQVLQWQDISTANYVQFTIYSKVKVNTSLLGWNVIWVLQRMGQ